MQMLSPPPPLLVPLSWWRPASLRVCSMPFFPFLAPSALVSFLLPPLLFCRGCHEVGGRGECKKCSSSYPLLSSVEA